MKKIISAILAALMCTTAVSAVEWERVNISESEKDALFNSWTFMNWEYDYKDISDDSIYGAAIMPFWSTGEYNRMSDGGMNDPYYWKLSDFTRMTNEMFGKTIDYSKTNERGSEDFGQYIENGYFYTHHVIHPYIYVTFCSINEFYRVSDDIYFVLFDNMVHGNINPNENRSIIVKKLDNGVWTLLKAYRPEYRPSNEEVEAYINPSSWAIEEIELADKAELIPEMSFDPEWGAVMTREQFAQLVVNYVEKTTEKTLDVPKTAFTDCKDTAVAKAYGIGVVDGVSDTEFNPYGLLTREQLATMLWRAINYVEKETEKEILTADGTLDAFADKDAVSDWAKDAVTGLNANAIMQGMSDTELSPKSFCTVEQSILLVYRTYIK